MPSHRQEHRDLVGTLQAQAMDGDVGFPGLRIGGVDEADRDVGTGIFRRIGRRRHQPTDVEAGLARQVHDLLAGGFGLVDRDRLDGIGRAFTEKEAEPIAGGAEQHGDARAAGEYAGDDAGAGHLLDVSEQHGRTGLGRPHHGAAGADIAVHAGQLTERIDRLIVDEKLTRDALQELQGGPQVCHGLAGGARFPDIRHYVHDGTIPHSRVIERSRCPFNDHFSSNPYSGKPVKTNPGAGNKLPPDIHIRGVTRLPATSAEVVPRQHPAGERADGSWTV